MRCQPNHSPKPPFSIHAPTATCTGPDSLPRAPLSEPTRRSLLPHFQSMLRPPPAQARNPFPCPAFRIHSPKPPFSIHAPIAARTGPESLPVRCLPNPLAEALSPPIFQSMLRPPPAQARNPFLCTAIQTHSPKPPFFNPCSNRRLHRPWGSEFAEQVRPYRPQRAHTNAQRPSDRTCRTAAIYQTPYLLYRARSHSMQSSSHTMYRRVPVGISARFSRSSSVGDISPSG